jgi:hypothetical protein
MAQALSLLSEAMNGLGKTSNLSFFNYLVQTQLMLKMQLNRKSWEFINRNNLLNHLGLKKFLILLGMR